MLNIKERESTNVVEIAGILKDLNVEEKQTTDGRGYVSCQATVKVDQEINGKAVECEIPVRMFSMALKKDGGANKIYQNIVKYKDQFTSLAACPENQPELASKVIINAGRLEENIWVDPNSGEERSTFQISTNFMNAPRNTSDFTEGATFELSGVILTKTNEVDGNGDDTGRLKVKFGVVRYGGRLDVIDLIAESANAVNFIEQNWSEGDTVNLNGAISINQSTKTWTEEQGFGEPIVRTKTVSRKELIILGGSASGLEEDYSYDNDAVKQALDERKVRIEELKQKANVKGKTQAPKQNGFGF